MPHYKNQTFDTLPLHETIAVCGAVGGAGRTSVTVNLAAFLAYKKRNIRIIDGDLQFGDAALALDLRPKLTLKDIAENKVEKNFADYSTGHQSGIQLFAAPHRPEHADLVTAEMLASFTETLQAESDILLVDNEVGLTERNIQVMEKSDRILLVTTPRMAAIRHTKLMVETLEALGMNHKVEVIVNQFTSGSVMKASEITGLTQTENIHFLSCDHNRLSESLDLGIPMVESHPKHSFSIGIAKLAQELFPDIEVKKDKQSIGDMVKERLKSSRGRKNDVIGKTTIKESGRS